MAKVKRIDNTRGLVESISNSHALVVEGCISFLLLYKKHCYKFSTLKCTASQFLQGRNPGMI